MCYPKTTTLEKEFNKSINLDEGGKSFLEGFLEEGYIVTRETETAYELELSKEGMVELRKDGWPFTDQDIAEAKSTSWTF